MLPMRLDPPPAATKIVFPAATIIPLTAALFAVLPFSTDVYLTAMVDLGREFGVAVAGVQRTLISFTLGFGLAHLGVGRIADRFGRRPTALAGLGLYVAASALAVAAPTLDALVAARFLQGLAAASGPILCRTIIRDAAPPDQAGRWLAKNGAYLGLAPLTAPLIGALLAALGGWRAALAFLAVYGAALLVVVWLRLPETRPAARGEFPFGFGRNRLAGPGGVSHDIVEGDVNDRVIPAVVDVARGTLGAPPIRAGNVRPPGAVIAQVELNPVG